GEKPSVVCGYVLESKGEGGTLWQTRLAVLDGSTGRVRVGGSLANPGVRSSGGVPNFCRATLVDIDGGGVRHLRFQVRDSDLFKEGVAPGYSLLAISGRSGRLLWTWRQSGAPHETVDGYSALAAPLVADFAGRLIVVLPDDIGTHEGRGSRIHLLD